VICDRALLGGYAKESRHINPRLIRQAAAEVKGQLERSPWIRRTAVAAGIVGAALIAASIWSVTQRELPPPSEPVAEEPAVVEPEPVPVAVAKELPAEEPAMEPAMEPEPGPTLDEQLQLAADLTSTEYALAALFETWGLEYRSGGRGGCAQAGDAGLTCLYQRGSWAGLRQMDRPAILTLVDDTGASHQVVLAAIIGDNAELSIGSVRVTHAVADITQAWFGNYMLLWRPPAGIASSLGPGSQGDDVTWLRNSLTAIDGRYSSEDPESDLFDAELEQIVRAFQREHRLDVDGLAGQQTQIIINSLLAVEGTPRLSAPRLAQE
jgi:general secretion pathway protein A